MNQEQREKAIDWIKEEIRSLERAPELNGCTMTPEWAAQLEIMRTCLEAVKDHFPDTTKMIPLTLEQLREMDGRPVWVEDLEKPEKSGWRLIYWDRGKYLVLLSKSAAGYILEEYGKTWMAYSYPPAHINREAWVSVEERNLPPRPKDGAWERYLVSAVMTYHTSIFEEPEEKEHVMAAFYDHEQKIWHLDNETVINALCEPDGSPLCGDYVTHWMPLPEPPAELEKRLRG